MSSSIQNTIGHNSQIFEYNGIKPRFKLKQNFWFDSTLYGKSL
jgi:hypothetical protein